MITGELKNRIDEESIKKIINPNFQLARKITEMQFGEKLLVLYEYLDTININCYNYLRNSEDFNKKAFAFNDFFKNLFMIFSPLYKIFIKTLIPYCTTFFTCCLLANLTIFSSNICACLLKIINIYNKILHFDFNE